ncbi:MAG: relaxase domain-containing protein [Acidimicrobiia bacterium]|nr:relaxase domain-containing protein [Acidimicrobiia bacterium]
MRFTITALGCSGASSVAGAVADVVRYLHGRRVLATPAHSASTGDQPGRYYSDSGEGAGRWLGLGADELGMAGLVDDHAFAQVLAGRHPRTGERLITAQGSAGRTATLGVGTETHRTANDERLYDHRRRRVPRRHRPGRDHHRYPRGRDRGDGRPARRAGLTVRRRPGSSRGSSCPGGAAGCRAVLCHSGRCALVRAVLPDRQGRRDLRRPVDAADLA